MSRPKATKAQIKAAEQLETLAVAVQAGDAPLDEYIALLSEAARAWWLLVVPTGTVTGRGGLSNAPRADAPRVVPAGLVVGKTALATLRKLSRTKHECGYDGRTVLECQCWVGPLREAVAQLLEAAPPGAVAPPAESVGSDTLDEQAAAYAKRERLDREPLHAELIALYEATRVGPYVQRGVADKLEAILVRHEIIPPAVEDDAEC